MGPCDAQRPSPRALPRSYAEAFAEWEASGGGEWWEAVTADGFDDALTPL